MIMKPKSFLLLSLLAIVASILPSCSSGQSADAADLIATVPSDASLVAVANVKAILEKAGCKVEGETVTPSDRISGLIAAQGDAKNRRLTEAILNGRSGIDPSVAVIFRVGYYTYFSGIAADPAALRKTAETDLGLSFSATDGVETGGNIAISGNRFWINLGQRSIDPKEVRHFMSLDKSGSFASNPCAGSLSKFSKDIEGWGSIAGLLNTSSIPFEQRAVIQVALQTLYEDPTAVTFNVDFGKGKTEITAETLNSKNSLARYQLPVSTIDTKTIEAIGGTADAVAAISIPAKMIEQLKKDASAKGPSVFAVYLDALSSIDGTTAVAFGQDAGDLRGIISTSGQNTAALTSFLGDAGLDVRIDGKSLRISKGDLKGQSDVAGFAAYFKNAVAGVATAVPKGKPAGLAGLAASGALTLHSKGNSIGLRVILQSDNPDENFLVTLINAGDKTSERQ